MLENSENIIMLYKQLSSCVYRELSLSFNKTEICDMVDQGWKNFTKLTL